jgi:Lon protease-like protein
MGRAMQGFTADASSSNLDRIARACFRLKVFPLPGVVVFPGTPTPFHVFEPRYRALVADALAGDRAIAIATLVSSADAAKDRPPIHAIATAGFIEHERRLPDGDYDLFFRAVARVNLAAEHGGWKPYREFTAELLHDVEPPGSAAALVARRAALEACLLHLRGALSSGSKARWLAEVAPRIASPSLLADIVAAALLSHPDRRMAALAELDVAKRLDLVTGEVADLLHILSPAPSPSA